MRIEERFETVPPFGVATTTDATNPTYDLIVDGMPSRSNRQILQTLACSNHSSTTDGSYTISFADKIKPVSVTYVDTASTLVLDGDTVYESWWPTFWDYVGVVRCEPGAENDEFDTKGVMNFIEGIEVKDGTKRD